MSQERLNVGMKSMAISIMVKSCKHFGQYHGCVCDLQLRRTDETVYERFESYEALKRQGKEPNIDHYDVVYVAPLSSYTDQTAMLEGLYTKFNVERPEDFRGHSLSVSDIVALKTDAVVSFTMWILSAFRSFRAL